MKRVCPKCSNTELLREVIVITKEDVEKLFGKNIKTLFGTHNEKCRYKIVQTRPCDLLGNNHPYHTRSIGDDG